MASFRKLLARGLAVRRNASFINSTILRIVESSIFNGAPFELIEPLIIKDLLNRKPNLLADLQSCLYLHSDSDSINFVTQDNKGLNEFSAMVVASTREMAIRKRIASIYNKREDDFPSLREYNDYLEEVEDMIFNLIEGNDVPAIEAQIIEYQRENAEQIMVAQARKAEEYAAALAASKGQIAHADNDTLVSQSTQVGTSTGVYAPAIAQPRPTGMAPQPVPLGSGHDISMYDYEDEEKMKLRAGRAAWAGGWSIEFNKKRALEEAFGSIWI